MKQWIQLKPDCIINSEYVNEFIEQCIHDDYILEIIDGNPLFNGHAEVKRTNLINKPNPHWYYEIKSSDILLDYDPREIQPLDKNLFMLD